MCLIQGKLGCCRGRRECVISVCSQGLEGLSLEYKEPLVHCRPRGYNKGSVSKICPPLTDHNFHQNHAVSVFQKSTNTPSKSTSRTSRATRTTETQGELFQKNSQTSTSSAEAFLARLSLSLGKEEDLKILGGLSSMRSLGSLGLKDLNYCSWKTSKDFSHTIKGAPLEQSSQPFLTWGIFSNGRYLTARITESRKTGKGCSLSDILEDQVDERYFLSEAQTKKIMSQTFEQTKRLAQRGGGKSDSNDSDRGTSYSEALRRDERPKKKSGLANCLRSQAGGGSERERDN